MNNVLTLTGRLMSDMPSELLAFLRSTVTSFVKLDLIRFFCENALLEMTAAQTAAEIGLDEPGARAALEQLSAAAVLESRGSEGELVYTLTREPAQRALAYQFVAACENSEFRTKVIFHIIRSMR